MTFETTSMIRFQFRGKNEKLKLNEGKAWRQRLLVINGTGMG